MFFKVNIGDLKFIRNVSLCVPVFHFIRRIVLRAAYSGVFRISTLRGDFSSIFGELF